ncbi:hypothetical protein EHP00_2207 [Ecytonucleospora hepatopenaei]|uniref:Uncharacterized protein n=1 Tax=Ecytonucleospora hepatopenaei TaxID=646526 RepID=A0A1W0E4V7_9MICR|nr:hypothetical protein EHP00_2207 [Ecytonucleospora hepatopenaei]
MGGEGWKRNRVELFMSEKSCGEKGSELVVKNCEIAKVMESREYQGVEYKGEEEDYEIHEGRKGIAADYKEEGE